MIVHITWEDGFVSAMGHRVALHLGGEPELKRRVLGTLAQRDDPPDVIQFDRGQPSDGAADDPVEAAEPEPELPPAPAPRAAGKPPPRRGQKGKS